jgi:hypothetical protein
MRIALITPDRGDRPEFIEHCRMQMKRQTKKDIEHIVVDSPPIDGIVDIVPRIRIGMKVARMMQIDCCMIIENDDYYADNYVEKMAGYFESGAALIGLEDTIYYSLQQRSWRSFIHRGRASLFCTGFRISALSEYIWPDDQLLYFDMHLWASGLSKKLAMINNAPIGMKHGVGFSPGNYHNGIVNGKHSTGMRPDENMAWLRRHTRPESFEFYRSYSEKLINKQ